MQQYISNATVKQSNVNKKRIVLLTLLIILVAGIGAGGFLYYKNSTAATNSAKSFVKSFYQDKTEVAAYNLTSNDFHSKVDQADFAVSRGDRANVSDIKITNSLNEKNKEAVSGSFKLDGARDINFAMNLVKEGGQWQVDYYQMN